MVSTEIPDDPLSKFALSIFRVHDALMRNGDMLTRSIGQSSARWQLLGRIGYKSQTVAQIARDMGHARQSVQRLADVLVKEGLAIYKDNPADRRAQLLELTLEGADVLHTIYTLNETWGDNIMTKLDAAQLVEIADALERIGAILEDDMDTKEPP